MFLHDWSMHSIKKLILTRMPWRKKLSANKQCTYLKGRHEDCELRPQEICFFIIASMLQAIFTATPCATLLDANNEVLSACNSIAQASIIINSNMLILKIKMQKLHWFDNIDVSGKSRGANCNTLLLLHQFLILVNFSVIKHQINTKFLSNCLHW